MIRRWNRWKVNRFHCGMTNHCRWQRVIVSYRIESLTMNLRCWRMARMSFLTSLHCWMNRNSGRSNC